MEITKELREVLGIYGILDKTVLAENYGSGHINDTVLVTLSECMNDMLSDKLIIQRINTSIFKKPDQLMANVIQVTKHIRKKIEAGGGDVLREVLNVIPTRDGNPYYVTESGQCYRAYIFVERGLCLDAPRTKEDFYESGMAFGGFQGQLADFPAEKLFETIPDFHNTLKRLEAFKQAVFEDVCGLVSEVREEIDFALSWENEVISCMNHKKNLPLRVTHNDTKLNNAMLDVMTQKALCVLDLDTVMPGYAMDDFGDSIRFGASTASEDETDLTRVSCDLSLFQAYTEGFLRGTEGRLTEEEIRLFPMGARMMTYECGIRFLMDYLQGNTYFKISYPEHNLVRARNQFALLRDMNEKAKEMERIVENCLDL